MENIKALDDIIGDLLDRGYSLGFEELQRTRLDLGEEHIQTLSANEFVIDEVYCCSDGLQDVIYVFAVSSVRYRIRGVVINTVTTETSITLKEIFQKIKGAFFRSFKALC